MSVSIAGTWTGSYAPPVGYVFPRSATGPMQVSVGNTAGDWMIAVVSIRQPQAGAGVSVTVSDDVHNWWEPLGAPATDSSASGVTRTMIWAAPAARAASYVQACPTGPYQALTVLILDVSGMQPGVSMTPVVTGYALAATALSLSAAAPSAQALLIASAATDLSTVGHTGPGAGWTALPSVSVTNGTDHTGDVEMLTSWQVTTGSATAAWTSTGSADWSGTIAGVLVSATAPVQPSPNWPVVITEAAIGSGPQTPPSQMTWHDMSARSLALQVQQGRQYSLSQLQAAQGTITLDNPDGALIPPGSGAFAGIDSGTPVRRRCYWPHGTMASTPWSIPFSGFFRRWPFAAPAALLRGQAVAEVSDIWAYATGSLNSMAREELLIDNPYALWPLDDSAGAPAGSNIAPGNSNPLTVTTAKLGAGGATQAWGASSGALLGDTSAVTGGSRRGSGASGTWSLALAGTSQNTNGYGYALICQDTGFPSISGNGVTVETWFLCNSNQNTGGFGFFNTSNTITVTNSNWVNGTPVVFTVAGGFTLPTGMTAGQVYFTIAQSGNTFQIATTPGGSAVTLSTNGSGYVATTTPWNPTIMALRNGVGTIISVNIADDTGDLFISGAGVATTTVDTSRDWRLMSTLVHLSLAVTTTTWRIILDGGQIGTYTGSMASPAPIWNELALGGIVDRNTQGYCMPGQLSLAAVYPYVLASTRVVAHEWGAIAGMKGDTAPDRVDRVLSYAGLAGRRWIGQEPGADQCASGQDIGGQSAASSAGNIAASTAPALLYVAPTGDITYLAKQYAWNQAIKWTLGDNTAGGEIPFSLAQFSTDYDPTRLYNDVKLTQLDTQSVTVPAGATAAATVAAMTAASEAQYGAQPYQQTAYLQSDYSAPYNAGVSLQDLAAWIAMVYGKPRNRVPGVTVNAAAYPAAWPLWGQASVGDIVQVNVRLPTAATSPIVSVIARVTQTQRSMQWTTDSPPAATIALTLDAAPEFNALTCDDPVRGLLNGANVLPW